MIYSVTPTNYLAINATCTNELELCQFAIIRMNEEDRRKIAESLYFIHKMQGFNCLDLVSIEYDVQGFYFDFGEENNPEPIDPLNAAALEQFFEQVLSNRFQAQDPEQPFKFIALTAAELEKESQLFNKPQQQPLPSRLRINSKGQAYWSAYSPLSNDEFITAELDLNQLLSLYEPPKQAVKLQFFNALNSTLQAAHQYFYLQSGDSIKDIISRYTIYEANGSNSPLIKANNIAAAQYAFDNLQLLDNPFYNS